MPRSKTLPQLCALAQIQKSHNKQIDSWLSWPQAGTSEAEQLQAGIPQLTDKAQQLEQQLQAQEQLLQQLQEGVRGEVEQHTQALQEVRRQLAPWEQQIGQEQSRLGVATAEQDMLQKSHADAQQRLQVCPHGKLHAAHLSCCLHVFLLEPPNWLHKLVKQCRCKESILL